MVTIRALFPKIRAFYSSGGGGEGGGGGQAEGIGAGDTFQKGQWIPSPSFSDHALVVIRKSTIPLLIEFTM